MNEEMVRLQGIWSIVALEVEGHTVSEPAFTGAHIALEQNRFGTGGMGTAYGGTFATDGSTVPPSIDMTFTEGPHKGKVSLGIYELDGDALTLCLGMAGRNRPLGFSTSPGSGHALEKLKRNRSEESARGAEASDASNGDEWPAASESLEAGTDPGLAAIQGEWKLVSGEMGGQPLTEDFLVSARRVMTGDEVTVSFGGQMYLKAKVSVDTAVTPHVMEYRLLAGSYKGKRQHGIFALDVNTLRICFSPPETPAPDSFVTKPGDGRTLTVWEPLNP